MATHCELDSRLVPTMAPQIGVDIVRIDRIENNIKSKGSRFLKRIFTDREIRYCNSKSRKYLSFAARFAAKEAFIKALACRPAPSYRDVEVQNTATGQPMIHLSLAKAKKFKLQGRQVTLSLSHEADFAIAVVLIL